MAAVLKIDSNVTGGRYAEETSIGVLPGSPVWYPIEPNSYDNFGGSYNSVARNPINQSRQNQKGVLVDLDSSGGFNTDVTHTNLLRLLQGFFFADIREPFDTASYAATALTDVNVDGTANDYLAAAFGMSNNVFAGSLLYASGASTAANNGLKVVDGKTADTAISVTDTGLVTEVANGSIRVQVVGFQFESGDLSVNATVSDLPALEMVLSAATSSLTISVGAPANNETVTIGSRVYTFKDPFVDAANNVYSGASAAAAATNLIAAINGAAGAGTLYGTGTVAHADVTASSGGSGVVTATATVPGDPGNLIAIAETMTNGVWSPTGFLAGGGGGTSFISLGLIPGQFIYIGGDTAGTVFATAADNGWARVHAVDHDVLTLDKTSGTMVDDAGAAKTIQLFFGKVLKNESDPDLIVRRTYNFERTLGAPDSALPTQIQAEYLTGAVANELTLNFSQADKVTADLAFMATDYETRTGAVGVKSGTRPAIVSEDAYNTSNDFARLKMTLLNATDSNPSALFAYVTDFSIGINNNASPNKAISVLGAFDVSVGNFVVEGNTEAYFSTVEATAAIRNNSDVTMDFVMVKANKGLWCDIPLITLGEGRLNVEQDQPIKLPLSLMAAADLTFDHTLAIGAFSYLPDVADPS